MKNLTEIVFILDRSGSMSGLEGDTIGGFNSVIEKQKKVEGDALVSTILFDHESLVLHDRIPLEKIEPLTEEDYEVRGPTALLDAVGDAVHHIKTIHKYAREEDVPEKTLFIITTDGMENASHKFDYKTIKKLVKQQQKAGWEFIFMGANIDAIQVAGSIGIKSSRAVNFHNDEVGIKKSFAALGAAIHSVRYSESLDAPQWRRTVDEDFKSRDK